MAYNKLSPLNLGPLPVDKLKAFGIDADIGDVIFSIAAQRHAIRGHAEEYTLCLPYLERTVQTPTHVGQAPDHKNVGIELIYEHIADKVIVLVAVHLEPREDGTYIVKSAYPINRDKLERRIRKKFIIETK